MEVEERHERKQRQPENPLLAVEKLRVEPPRDPQRKRGICSRKQIIRPIRRREHAEPEPHDQHCQRRVLGIPQCQFAGEHELFGHVDMDILAALGDDPVGGPQHDIDEESQHDRSFPPRGIAQRAQKIVGKLRLRADRASQCRHVNNSLDIALSVIPQSDVPFKLSGMLHCGPRSPELFARKMRPRYGARLKSEPGPSVGFPARA